VECVDGGVRLGRDLLPCSPGSPTCFSGARQRTRASTRVTRDESRGWLVCPGHHSTDCGRLQGDGRGVALRMGVRSVSASRGSVSRTWRRRRRRVLKVAIDGREPTTRRTPWSSRGVTARCASCGTTARAGHPHRARATWLRRVGLPEPQASASRSPGEESGRPATAGRRTLDRRHVAALVDNGRSHLVAQPREIYETMIRATRARSWRFHHHNLLSHATLAVIDPKPMVVSEFDLPTFLWNPIGHQPTREIGQALDRALRMPASTNLLRKGRSFGTYQGLPCPRSDRGTTPAPRWCDAALDLRTSRLRALSTPAQRSWAQTRAVRSVLTIRASPWRSPSPVRYVWTSRPGSPVTIAIVPADEVGRAAGSSVRFGSSQRTDRVVGTTRRGLGGADRRAAASHRAGSGRRLLREGRRSPSWPPTANHRPSRARHERSGVGR